MILSRDRFDAAIFDLDGTLLDTLLDIAEAANRSLEQHDFPAHPVEAFRYFVGDGPDILFQRATQATSCREPHVLKLVDTYREECLNQADRHTSIYDGMADLLRTLQQTGLSLNILTNKRQPHAEICVNQFLNQWSWNIVLGSGDHIPKKPDPSGAIKITQELGVAAERCLYLGDTDVDMWTAKKAGMTAVGVLWGFREQEELKAAGADILIQHPTDLLS